MLIDKTNATCHDTAPCRPLDITKPVQVSSGFEARYLGSINIGNTSFMPRHIFAAKALYGSETLVVVDNNGIPTEHNCASGGFKIVNIPEPKRSEEVWLNVFRDRATKEVWTGATHNSKEEANRINYTPGSTERIACIRVPWTEGEGLEK